MLTVDQHVLVDAATQQHHQTLWMRDGLVLDAAWQMTTRIFVGHAHQHHHNHNHGSHNGRHPHSPERHHEGFGWALRGTWEGQPEGDVVQIWCHPSAGLITVERSDRPCVIYRKQGGLVPLLRQATWHQYTLIHRPASGGQGGVHGQGSLWLIIREESAQRGILSLSFPLNLRLALGAFGHGHHHRKSKKLKHPNPRNLWRLRLGLRGSTGHRPGDRASRFRVHAHDWQVQYLQPDLRRTQVFWVEASSVHAGETGLFLLQLRDACGEVLGASPWGLSVQLRRVRSDRIKARRGYDPYRLDYWAPAHEGGESPSSSSSSGSSDWSDSFSNYDQPQRRRDRSSRRRRHRLGKSPRVHDSDVQGEGGKPSNKPESSLLRPLSWIPPSHPIHTRSLYNQRSGVYEVYYRPSQPGRYRLWVALKMSSDMSRRGRDLGVGARQWVQLPHHHIYVRNLW